jgi:LysR family transcriptional regulator, glycine cleavage system transcriptional activator
MKDQLPPLNPLRIFYVAARSASFTEAARQLSVTQAAVSRQIGTLEDFFAVKLFDRDHRALTLTSAGRHLYREVGPAFDAIIAATTDTLRYRNPDIVFVQSYPTLIARKLLPNLTRLVTAQPRLEVNFVNAVRPDEFSLDRTDIMVRLFDTMPNGLRGFLFAQDVIAPAAAPSLIEKAHNDLGRVLESAPLLATKYRHSDWTDWASLVGLDLNRRRFHHFDSSDLAYQAALNGVGICMAQCFLVANDIAAGRLRYVSKKNLARQSSYWAVMSPRKRITRQLKSTLDWLEGLKDPKI